MSSVWLLCAAGSKVRQLTDEIERRCPHAQLMRMGCEQGVSDVARVLSQVAVGAAVSFDEAATAERVVRELADAGWCAPIVVLIARKDAGAAACLFAAGATEVIAAEGAACNPPISRAETKDCPEDAGAAASPAGTHEEAYLAEVDDLDDVPEWQIDRFAADLEEPPWVEPHGAVESLPKSEDVATPVREVEGSSDGVATSMTLPAFAKMAMEDALPGKGAIGSGSIGDKGEASGRETMATAHTGTVLEEKIASPISASSGGAPLVAVISGRGGVGKTTLTAAMAFAAASMGLRAAVLDLDLMFGNMYDMVGVDEPNDLASLAVEGADFEGIEAGAEATAMRVAPGVTLWGPALLPERAELLSGPIEQLIGLLRQEADIIFADTSTFWGDGVACAVAQCDRCIVVGQTGCASSAIRAIELASRIGVAKTKMTSAFNRFGRAGNQEEQALRFEMAVSLRSRMRVAEGGDALEQMQAFGRLGEFVAQDSAFSRDVTELVRCVAKELGCDIGAWEQAYQVRAQQVGGRGRRRFLRKRQRGEKS